MPSRPTPPLFELLRAASPEAKPLPPRSAPVRPSPPSAPRAAPPPPSEPPGSRWDLREPLTLPWNAVFIAIACVLVLLAGVWAGAYNLGRAREKAEWERMGLTQAPRVREPQGDTPEDETPAKPQDLVRPDPPLPVPGGHAVLSTGGRTTPDPRLAAHNYLKLAASVPEPEAKGVIDFLASQNVQAIGVPVDPGRTQGNNPVRYDLYTLMGVGSSEFRARARERDEHRDLLTRLGERWRREHRGTVDFARSHWDKHEG